MQNKAELLTRAGLLETILPTASNDNQAVKARREVVARTVSSVAQTRVWNLVIDVVAQSGHLRRFFFSFRRSRFGGAPFRSAIALSLRQAQRWESSKRLHCGRGAALLGARGDRPLHRPSDYG
jgi:hypothetical protein